MFKIFPNILLATWRICADIGESREPTRGLSSGSEEMQWRSRIQEAVRKMERKGDTGHNSEVEWKDSVMNYMGKENGEKKIKVKNDSWFSPWVAVGIVLLTQEIRGKKYIWREKSKASVLDLFSLNCLVSTKWRYISLQVRTEKHRFGSYRRVSKTLLLTMRQHPWCTRFFQSSQEDISCALHICFCLEP